ncbi:MAG: sucC [Chlamydiales bacterium]|jgi:succinyl-CoA synthetase beta subunit|nr:sucC [Chlamydiales bacterium]
MHIHEYQAKEILKKYEIPIPPYGVASSLEEAKKIIDLLSLDAAVVKIQVHAGGRGKAGGVKIAHGCTEILKTVEQLLGMKLINKQTTLDGVVANKVLITTLEQIKQEYYIGISINRSLAAPILIVSREGGADIEEVANRNPEKILMQKIALDGNLKPFQLLSIVKFLGWEGNLAKQGITYIKNLIQAFMENDAYLLEINPLAETVDGRLLVLDAKLSVDENALYRQPELQKLYDPTQYLPSENLAKEHELTYIGLDGNIGCLVNGAGLAMATMDLLRSYSGHPANFLDVGGGASKEQVEAGFKMVLSNPRVTAGLINIFGGIMDCNAVTDGVIAAAKGIDSKIPIIIRMEGTCSTEAKQKLQSSGLNIFIAESMEEAAIRAVAISQPFMRKV